MITSKITTAARSRLGSATAEALHERARESALQQRQLLITLATACLAVFFVTITGVDAGKLDATQRIYARLGLIGMAFSVFGGVIALFSDARRNYNQARQIQASEKQEIKLSQAFRQRYLAWKAVLKVANWIQRICFLAGIIATVAYTLALLASGPSAPEPTDATPSPTASPAS